MKLFVQVCLFLAFFLSGASGLIYQTVWVRMLTRYLGTTTHATATVLIVFMGGLAIGSWLASRFTDRLRRPLVVYCLLELSIGAFGLLSTFAIREGIGEFYIRIYDQIGDQFVLALAARVLFVVVCLLPPTILMGATLPIIFVFVTRAGEHFQAGLGRLYALNTFGAVAGVLATGFYLLGEYGELNSLYVAFALNLLAGALTLLLASRQPTFISGGDSRRVQAEPVYLDQPYPPAVRRLALCTLFVTGFTALAYEVIWSRVLVLMLGTSMYAFSAMLATFLVGLAVGSLASAKASRLKVAPLAPLGVLLLFGGFWGAFGLLLIPISFDVWLEFEPYVAVEHHFLLGLIACVLIVLPVAYCFGRQFPLAVRCCASDSRRAGSSVGLAYAVNTVGAILGSLVAGFFILPILGATTSVLLLSGISLLLGFLWLLLAMPEEAPSRYKVAGCFGGGFALVLACMWVFLGGDAYRSMILAKNRHDMGEPCVIFGWYEGAGATTIATGYREDPTVRSLLINGMGITRLCTETKVMAHLPYHLVEKPERMLVICFGMGTTFRSATSYPDLRVDAVEIVPEVYECFRFFHDDADQVLRRPNGFLHRGDGRNYLLTHHELYDVITIDPAPPIYSSGTVNLYTKEFFALCKSRLTPGGLLCVWLPPAEEAELKMIMRSYLDIFPEATVWCGLDFSGFYLIGGHRSFEQTPAQVAMLAEKLSKIEDLGEWGESYRDPEYMRNMYLLDARGLGRLVGQSPAVTDDMPYTEFPMRRQWMRSTKSRFLSGTLIRKQLPELLAHPYVPAIAPK